MTKDHASPQHIHQLPLSLNRQSFLQTKKKLRERDSREAIDGIWQRAILLKFKLQSGAIKSPEARFEIQQFLENLGVM